jgi:hypothetical protein
MRSRTNGIVSSPQVHQWALDWLLQARLLKDHGWLCTAAVVWNVVLRAAARATSLFAACRDLADAPSDQAVRNALAAGLPRTLPVLEKRLNEALTGVWRRRLRRRRWPVAIDWHLAPYYGQPQHNRNEIYRGQAKQGTTKFHAYATACIVAQGERYTLALTWVRRGEATATVLQRLLTRIGEIDVKIKRLLLDRAFFSVAVMAYLQEQRLPYLMPVVFRGRTPKKKGAKTGLRWLKRQKAGWHSHTMKNGERTVTFGVCVAYRSYPDRKNRRRGRQKLLFAAWRVRGAPTEIRQRYRRRFGIETSFRQMRQARIFTCTRNPHLRLVFVAVALLLRNLWVWIHAVHLAERRGARRALHLDLLRFKRLLDWIARAVDSLLHSRYFPCVDSAGAR